MKKPISGRLPQAIIDILEKMSKVERHIFIESNLYTTLKQGCYHCKQPLPETQAALERVSDAISGELAKLLEGKPKSEAFRSSVCLGLGYCPACYQKIRKPV